MSRVVPGTNDLFTTHPALAKEAHGWDPKSTAKGSDVKLTWKCPIGHIYKASPNSRTNTGSGCSVCAGKQVLLGFNDLFTFFPDISKEADGWDPRTVVRFSSKKYKWKCSLGHSYEAKVSQRTAQRSGCPVCAGKQVLVGFNDLKTTHPQLAKEAYGWDPSTLTRGQKRKVRWQCSLGHDWYATVNSRTNSHKPQGCPYCAGVKVWVGFNDLQSKCPEVASQADGWDPKTVSYGASQKKRWKCHKGHKWVAQVCARTGQKQGCPVCSGTQVLAGFNDLMTTHPSIAKEADGWDASCYSKGSVKTLAWRCALGHQYRTSPNARTNQGSGCPYCAGRKLLKGFNDLATHFPRLASEASGWSPSSVARASHQVKEWCCQKCHHKWSTTVLNRTVGGSDCPACSEGGGYKSKLDGWFYLMARPGEQQIGISNYIDKRLRTHDKSGWYVLDVVGPADGGLVLETEKVFKKWLRTDIGLVPGTHENWFSADLEVCSLGELKSRSGIETELF